MAGAYAKPGSPLSPRELEVLRWMYYGKTNEQIGMVMGIAELTVKNHVQAILRRLNVETRLRAVTLALEQGIIYMNPNGKRDPPKDALLRIPG